MPSGLSVQAYVWPSGTLRIFGSRTLTGQAGVDQVERDLHLVEQHGEAGEAVAFGAGHHAEYVLQFAVRQVRLVAAEVRVHPGGAGDRAGDAVLRDEFGRELADADRAGPE